MAVVTILGTATFNTTSGTKTVTGTPAVGDLIVIVTANTGSTTTTAAPTDNNGAGGTYTLIATAVKATSADTMQVWVRNALITAATSTTFTQAPGTTTGGGLIVMDVQGMSRVGSAAVVRSGIQSNQAAGGTPAPALGATPSSANPVISAVFNASSPVGVTARAGYSSVATGAYNTPTTGISVIERDSGETSATITWGGTSATAFASLALELDARVTHTTTGTLAGQGSAVAGTAFHSNLHGTTGSLAGQGATIAGSAARAAGAVTHATSGALAGPGAALAGSAARSRAFATSGALAGQGATLAGAAARTRVFPTSGSLVGSGAAVTGSAARTGATVSHATSGALSGPGAVVAGTAAVAAPQPVPQGGHFAPQMKRKRRWEEDKEEQEALRQLIAQAVDPQEPVALQLEGDVVQLATRGDNLTIPVPPEVDPGAVLRAVEQAVERAGAQIQSMLEMQAERARVEEEQRQQRRRKRQQRVVLMMEMM